MVAGENKLMQKNPSQKGELPRVAAGLVAQR
jgi:hypothetical protein